MTPAGDAVPRAEEREPEAHRIIHGARARYDALKRELSLLWGEYEGLEGRMRAEVNALSKRLRELQMRRHLERHEVATVQIPGIGPGRKATLASYGVETAADVSETALAEIPGMTPALNQALIAWRAQVESTFRFTPHGKVEPEDEEEVEERFDERRREIERKIVAGADRLLELRQNAEARARLALKDERLTS